MILFVVGLNHQMGGCLNCGVDASGMRRLAQAIYQAWPHHPESVVIISSSFRAPCGAGTCSISEPPASPDYLIEELILQPHLTLELLMEIVEGHARPSCWHPRS